MALIKVGNFSQDITNFDPANDQLDFGNISVHSLILGQEPDGTATIVYPWQPNQFQRILGANGQGIQWSDLSEGNFAPVGNEHLRGDIGGVFSWEKGIGPAFDPGNPDRESTVYIRSHERDSVTTIENFDPVTDKINFLYFGTRERLSVVNEGADLVISSEPIGQRFVFKGVQKEELIGANLEFHFDQIQEDLLDRAFGFQPEQLSLVNRTMLFTPEGGPTDGFQTRVGAFVTASGEAPGQPRSLEESTRQIQERAEQQQASEQTPQEMGSGMPMDMDMGMDMDMDMDMGMDMDMTPPDLTKVVMNLPGGSNVHNSCLQLEVDGSLWWGGGMGGNLIVRNPMGFAVDDWEVSFLTPHDQFQSWAGNATVEDAGNGLNRVTFTPADWNDSIPANGEISISFNAQGEGMPNSGSLTRSNFFAPAQASMTMEMGMDMDMDMDMGMEMGARMEMPMEVGMEMGSGMEMEMNMSAMSSDVVTGQLMDVANPLASESLELIGNDSGYAIARGDGLIALVRRSGKALSDATSDWWDFLAAKDAFGGGFRVLAEGEGDRDGQFRVFRFDEEGELFGRGRWISEEKAISRGLEVAFAIDLNGDG
ncbi:hypothetical protein DBR45_06015, partial [Pseudomonas sp. HMWF031]